MVKILQPERLDADPNSSEATREWNIGKKNFQNFLTPLNREGLDKLLGVLTNYLSPKIYQYIEDFVDYPTAIAMLQTLYIKPTKEVFAQHLLATRHQQPAETLYEYFQALKALSNDCNYQNVTSMLYHEESIRDAFTTGLTSGLIRQRLLENKILDLKTIFDQARSLETVAHSSESYRAVLPPVNAAIVPDESCDPTTSLSTLASASASASGLQRQKCFFCGYSRHPRSKCPTRDATCSKCQKKGHFKKVCRGNAPQLPAEHQLLLATNNCCSIPIAHYFNYYCKHKWL